MVKSQALQFFRDRCNGGYHHLHKHLELDGGYVGKLVFFIFIFSICVGTFGSLLRYLPGSVLPLIYLLPGTFWDSVLSRLLL